MDLEALSARWRRSRQPADFLALARQLPAGTPGSKLIGRFGSPLVVSPVADGGESWLYVKADAERRQFESLSLDISADGELIKVDRKPIE